MELQSGETVILSLQEVTVFSTDNIVTKQKAGMINNAVKLKFLKCISLIRPQSRCTVKPMNKAHQRER